MKRRKSGFNMLLRFAAIVITMLMLVMLIPMTVFAEKNNGYGNAWVYDEANVISEETEEYVNTLNETFATYKSKPQLAFIILNTLPDEMDKYKLDMFNEYGVGTKEENCGMLFVIAVEDKEYGFEIGDGFKKGTFLRKDLESNFSNFISVEIKSFFQRERYDDAVYEIAEHLASIMQDAETGVYAMKQAEHDQKQQEMKDKAENTARIAGIIFISIVASIILIVAFYHLFVYIYRRSTISAMIKKYDNHMWLFKDQEADTKKKLHDTFSSSNAKYIEEMFLSELHDFYLELIDKEILAFCRSDKAKYEGSLYSEYVKEYRAQLTLDDFEKLNLIDIDNVIAKVDEKHAQYLKTMSQNIKIVDEFLAKNDHRIENRALVTKLKESFKKFTQIGNRLVTNDELECHFVETMDSLIFECEFEMFLEKNQDKIKTRDFNRNAFYKELLTMRQQENYRIDSMYLWMLRMLPLHIANQNNIRKRKEQEERRLAEQRKRDAQRRAQSYSSNNSSFGSGFRGGYSSGGGFSGKW